MDLSLRRVGKYTEMTLISDNVKIVEDLSVVEYAIDEDGKKDFSKRLGVDVSDENMEKFTSFLDELFCYRDKDFDSTGLIENMFGKLPLEKAQSLLEKLKLEFDLYP